ncbi:hypothetical protein FACS189468_9260 [Spirochaetia bacterium]|nr:hypothetical protein FACS189468_9260 [Spirochaetia bacterium]
MLKGHCIPGVVTGKPIEVGGAVGRNEATGRGILFTVKNTLSRLSIPLKGLSVAIQGMGNVGGTSAKLLAEEGAKILAVSDVSGGLFNPEGLNIPDILSYVGSNREALLKDYSAPGVKHISNEELLKLDVTVLIPAALGNQINEKNVNDIQAKIIVEAANGPTTVEADHVLQEKKVLVVPDILANAGGVIVSYFEWVQNIQSLTWDKDMVNKKLKDIITTAFTAVWDITAEKKVSMRTGAYLIAVKKLVDSNNIRGIWP